MKCFNRTDKGIFPSVHSDFGMKLQILLILLLSVKMKSFRNQSDTWESSLVNTNVILKAVTIHERNPLSS